MRVLNFTIIKLSFCLILGIILAQSLTISVLLSICITFITLVLLSAYLIISKKQFKKTIWFSILAYLTTLSIGILVTVLQDEKQFKKHYSQLYTSNQNSPQTILFRINEVLKPGIYNDKYVIDIIKIEHKNVTGKSLLNIKKDSLNTPLNVDAVYIAKTTFKTLNTPLNPNQFDYKSYLEKRHIYHQLFIENEKLLRISNTTKSFKGYASRLRNFINIKLKNYDFKRDELAIINALILGQRQGISKDIYTNYTNAGAIHILAVSGLHIGILLLLLNTLLKPFEWLKNGKLIKILIILLLLWSYAFLAGASASIVRASTMFSVIAIGMHLKRPSNIYNTLAISIFLILLFKPLFLFDVGFQLSYIAVLAIVTIQPLLYPLFNSKFWIINKLWQILTVTLSAQLGVLPISLFYFHQFSGLFWLSNLIVIPFLGIILSSGIATIILALLNILPQCLADLFGGAISVMNYFFKWISSYDKFIIKNISFSVLDVIISYLILIALIRLFITRKYKALVFLCTTIICLQLVFIYKAYKHSNDAFIIFHKSRQTIIGHKQNNSLSIFHNTKSIITDKVITNFTVASGISTIKMDSLQYLYTFKKEQILLIDSLGLYQINTIKPDYVILQNSPKINLERLIDFLKPKVIIADGSNYKSYLERWAETCKKRKLPFHQTSKKGAFILK